MSLRALHHVQVAMPSGEEDRAEDFYAGVLGLRRVEKPAALAGRGGAWFRGDGVEVHLGVEPDFRPARKAHLAFVVGSLDDLRRRLEGAGVELEEQPQLEGYRRLHAFDPFGNRLEFLEPLEAG
jgi:catechol 2,3-dioxygenase-like lactoylglutathione lyase family enzyme